MRVRHKLIPRKDRVLQRYTDNETETQSKCRRSATIFPANQPVVELETRSPVWCSEQRLKSAGQVHKHVAHQEKPAGRTQTEIPQKSVTQLSDFVLNAVQVECFLNV